MLEKLKNSLERQTEEQYQIAFLGSNSHLCQVLRSLRVDVDRRNPNQDQNLSLDNLAGLLDERFKLDLEDEENEPNGLNMVADFLNTSEESAALLPAIYHALRASKCISKPDSGIDLDFQLQRLFKSLHLGLGIGEPQSQLIWGAERDQKSRNSNSVEDCLNPLKENQHPAVYWMAYDLLDRLVSRKNRNREKTRSAATTIVAAAKSSTRSPLFTLTVELIESADGPIYPDFFHVGLTDVRDVAKRFEEVWKVSGLSKWFRCRWRIEFNDKTRQPKDVEQAKFADRYASAIGGNSAQAACLLAVLAACGDPYRVKSIKSVNDFPAPEKIALDVAVSAAVDCSPKPNQSVIELSLSKVGKVPQKLGATRGLLDFLVLYDNEYKDDEIDELIAERKEYDDSTTALSADKPVGIEFASTVENVLDLLLESNQYLSAYRESIQNAWLKQWEVNTGRFPGQPNAVEGNPDFENRPAQVPAEQDHD